MYKKVLSVIFLLLIFIFQSVVSMQQAADGMITEQLEGVPTLTEVIKNDLKDAKQGLSEALDLFKNMKTYFKATSYINSNNVAVEKVGQGGIYFDFGYRSHGELTSPFIGFKTKVDFEKVPDWLEVAFVNTLTSPDLGFNSIINVSAKNEFLIKLILLFNDAKKRLINAKEVTTELLFLFYRLALVKEVNDFKSFFEGDNNLIYKIISSIKINGKSITNFLDNYWTNFNEIVNYDFYLEEGDPYSITANDLIESDDWATIFKISSAIGLRTSIDYYKAREKFLKTPKGLELNLKITNATTKKEKLKFRKEFMKAMPEYAKIIDNVQKRVHGFLRRIKGIRKNWNQFIEKIRPTLEPFFDSIGLPFDLIIRNFDDLDDMDASERFYDDSAIIFDEDSSEIDFYGEEDFSFTDF